jgi:hypothetical protein
MNIHLCSVHPGGRGGGINIVPGGGGGIVAMLRSCTDIFVSYALIRLLALEQIPTQTLVRKRVV